MFVFGRIQQIQLLGRDMRGSEHDQLWNQIEAEIHLHRHKTVIRACRGRKDPNNKTPAPPPPSTSKATKPPAPPSVETQSQPSAKSSKQSTMVSEVVPPSPTHKMLTEKQKGQIRSAFGKTIEPCDKVTITDVQKTLRQIPSLLSFIFKKQGKASCKLC